MIDKRIDLSKILIPTGEKGENKGRKKKIKETRAREVIPDDGDKVTKKIKRKLQESAEVNLIDLAKKEEIKNESIKSEAITIAPQDQLVSAIKTEVVSIKQEAPTEIIEENKVAEENDNNPKKLIEDVKDESLLASLKHLMEREDLDEIIMSLDFV